MHAEIYTWSYCPYCTRAKQLLEQNKIPFQEYNIDNDISKKKALQNQTNQNTVPYIFIDHKFIGGFKELKKLIKKKN
ncbi:MAG: glutaredoxin domain-containing protein [Eubacteriales bacterium]